MSSSASSGGGGGGGGASTTGGGGTDFPVTRLFASSGGYPTRSVAEYMPRDRAGGAQQLQRDFLSVAARNEMRTGNRARAGCKSAGAGRTVDRSRKSVGSQTTCRRRSLRVHRRRVIS